MTPEKRAQTYAATEALNSGQLATQAEGDLAKTLVPNTNNEDKVSDNQDDRNHGNRMDISVDLLIMEMLAMATIT
jgi:hypothetical protein